MKGQDYTAPGLNALAGVCGPVGPQFAAAVTRVYDEHLRADLHLRWEAEPFVRAHWSPGYRQAIARRQMEAAAQ